MWQTIVAPVVFAYACAAHMWNDNHAERVYKEGSVNLIILLKLQQKRLLGGEKDLSL